MTRRGRPSLDGSEPSPRIGVHVTKTQRVRLTRLASAQRVSLASLVREFIDDGIDRAREDDDDQDGR